MNLHPITRLDEAPLFAGLTNAQLRSRVEPANGIFIAESPKVIASALRAGCVPVAMLTARRHLAPQAALIDRCGDIPVYTADDETLAQLTGCAPCGGRSRGRWRRSAGMRAALSYWKTLWTRRTSARCFARRRR